MKMNLPTLAALLGAVVLNASSLIAADDPKPQSPKPQSQSGAEAKLFEDEFLCKGKGVEIRRSELDEAFVVFKANLAANGQAFPEARREEAETQLLDRLVSTKLLVHHASEEDKANAKAQAEKQISEAKQQAGSDDAFQRLLRARAVTPEKYAARVLESAICEEVLNRELKSKVTIPDEQARKFYEDNSQEFERPEMVRVAHVLLSTRDTDTGQELNEDKRKEKKQQLGKILERARNGEDFGALVRQFSDDPGSRGSGGEYTFARAADNPRNAMVREFETAAFSLKTNQISDIVTTQFGYHIIKLHERLPAQKLEFSKIEKDLKEYLARQAVEKQLPAYVDELKKAANLEYQHGAKPPAAPPEKPPSKPESKPAN